MHLQSMLVQESFLAGLTAVGLSDVFLAGKPVYHLNFSYNLKCMGKTTPEFPLPELICNRTNMDNLRILLKEK